MQAIRLLLNHQVVVVTENHKDLQRINMTKNDIKLVSESNAELSEVEYGLR